MWPGKPIFTRVTCSIFALLTSPLLPQTLTWSSYINSCLTCFCCNWPTDDDDERRNVLPNIVFCDQQSILECLYINGTCFTRWVPFDGYIRHQNDYLSGRMTDISVMGERQVPGVGGTRPLWNILGCSQGTIFVRSSKLSLFFPELCSFQIVFFCFLRFCKIWCQTVKLWDFWLRRCLGALFENFAP